MVSAAANPPRPKNWNCTMSASGWGTIRVKAMRIGHGISIVANQSATRFGNAFYVTKRTSGSFGLVVLCTSDVEYERLGAWIQGYGRAAANPSGGIGPVRVMVPSRHFDKVAIPSGTTFGDDIRTITHEVAINFGGARDPVPLNATFVSRFYLPGGKETKAGWVANSGTDTALPYFYPAGKQLSGTGMGEDALYDDPVAATPYTPPGKQRLPNGKIIEG